MKHKIMRFLFMASVVAVYCQNAFAADPSRQLFVDELKAKQMLQQNSPTKTLRPSASQIKTSSHQEQPNTSPPQSPPPRPPRNNIASTQPAQADTVTSSDYSPEQSPPPRPSRRHTAGSQSIQQSVAAVQNSSAQIPSPPKPQTRRHTSDAQTIKRNAAATRHHTSPEQSPPKPERKVTAESPSVAQLESSSATAQIVESPRKHQSSTSPRRHHGHRHKSPDASRHKKVEAKTEAAVEDDHKQIVAEDDLPRKIKQSVVNGIEFLKLIVATRDNVIGFANDIALIAPLITAFDNLAVGANNKPGEAFLKLALDLHSEIKKAKRSENELMAINAAFKHELTKLRGEYIFDKLPKKSELAKLIDQMLTDIGNNLAVLKTEDHSVYKTILDAVKSKNSTALIRSTNALKILSERVYINLDVPNCTKKEDGYRSAFLDEHVRCLQLQPEDVQYKVLLNLFKALMSPNLFEKEQLKFVRELAQQSPNNNERTDFAEWVKIYNDSLKPIQPLSALFDRDHKENHPCFTAFLREIDQLRTLLPQEKGVDNDIVRNGFSPRYQKTASLMQRFDLPLGQMVKDDGKYVTREFYKVAIDLQKLVVMGATDLNSGLRDQIKGEFLAPLKKDGASDTSAQSKQ